MTLAEYLKDLADEEKPQTYSGLLQLSDLSQGDTAEFEVAWASLSKGRRGEILRKLVELGEDNLELDFGAVFLIGLKDVDDDVREKAAQGLWECEDRSVIRPLASVLLEDPSPRVRAAAAISLRRFATMAQHGKLISRDADRVRDVLMSAIDREGETEEVRRRAIEAVACFDRPETDAVIRQAYDGDDLRLLQSAVYAMGQSSKASWLPTVLDEMSSEHPEVRYEAAVAAGLLGDETTVPHLIELLQDEDVEVQVAAVRGIGSVGGPLAKRALQQCLKMDEVVAEAAESALQSVEFDEDPLGFRFEV